MTILLNTYMYQQKKPCHRQSVFTVYVLLDKKEVFIIQVSQGLLEAVRHCNT